MADYTPPSTLDGIKRLAKKLKKDRNIPHTQALEQAATIAGYQNYTEARHKLAE